MFSDPPVLIEKIVARPDFENWIARYLEQIAGCVDRLLKTVALKPDAIDSVFLTGGSSFVPAVRRIFIGALRQPTESAWATSSHLSRAASPCARSTRLTDSYRRRSRLEESFTHPTLSFWPSSFRKHGFISGIGSAS